ncbi:MAG TPA: universal stress protein [Deltaproteobacteria bacterium]|nr:universal stress protein [Deltaproteobacteria bacterium]
MDMMVAVDLADGPETVMAHALAWASRLGATIHLRSVSHLLGDPAQLFGDIDTATLAQEWARCRASEASALERLSSKIPHRLRGSNELLVGPPGATLSSVASGFDLLLLGTHGRTGLKRLFLGSVAERVVREANAPVLVVHLDGDPPPEDRALKVMAPLDASEIDLRPLQLAREWLGPDTALHVVYALADLRLYEEIGLLRDQTREHPHREWAEHQLSTALAEAGIEAEQHYTSSFTANPGGELAEVAAALEVDLVTMPTHGRRGLQHLAYGSVAERLVRSSPCATLIVRG